MKRTVLGLIAVVLMLTGCTAVGDFLFPSMETLDPDLEISYSFIDFEGAWRYVDDLAQKGYVLDIAVYGIKDYWQYPSETYAKQAGDCEDFALLLMHLWNRMGYDTSLYIYWSGETTQHACIRIGDYVYEAQCYGLSYVESSLEAVMELNYSEAFATIRSYQ